MNENIKLIGLLLIFAMCIVGLLTTAIITNKVDQMIEPKQVLTTTGEVVICDVWCFNDSLCSTLRLINIMVVPITIGLTLIWKKSIMEIDKMRG